MPRSGACPAPAGPAVEVFADALARRGSAVEVISWEHAVHDHLDGHDRVVILTHPDAAAEAAEAITVPGHEHVITDPSTGWFTAIPHIEMARTADWPF